ncbi:hypothetical protein SS1G_04654 [Sclerotinia sclerotiorum 1980 UF-70]|uniref:NADH:ubiquinone oxidoreductase intermediate-associated protein 30 domain-containing protein n=1 Tax=Sclerotinia sclerotiorum (strain ATCC 18683 / 1980 / Ss-1) TaxID=665079 RepID=A7EH62_SCLS1|nr:hypothetical protein SS1G_04654 [Sclerotinia sclerotiorum 1980 UF-70]EDO02178.1 hypothetical protein SS1G_04654 [Sclerotinia sclerotiorum 1980 UF-70]
MDLFGGSKPWSALDWTSSDDRVRGGASQSYLECSTSSVATFSGTLDIKTLGGAGFASQRTTADHTWDLTAFDGILLDLGKSDQKQYTFIIKDELLPKSPNGREQSTISWDQEGDFSLAIMSISATKDKENINTPYRDDPNEKGHTNLSSGIDEAIRTKRQSWLGWFFGSCNVS